MYSEEKGSNIRSTRPPARWIRSLPAILRGAGSSGHYFRTQARIRVLGGGATYGFTVKPNYLGDLFRTREREVFASSCRAIPVVQGSIETKYPALGQYSPPTVVNGLPQPAVFAGITLGIQGAMTSARVESDANDEEIDFKVVDLTGATSYSRDYIVDNFIAMDSIVTAIFGDALAWQEDWVTIRGNALGQPQGFFATPKR